MMASITAVSFHVCLYDVGGSYRKLVANDGGSVYFTEPVTFTCDPYICSLCDPCDCHLYFDVAMGKSKSKQKKHTASITSVKNIKLKSKAKPVSTQLKRMNVQNKSKIKEVDRQLAEVQDKIRQSSSAKPVKMKVVQKKTSKTEQEFHQEEQNEKETLQDLNQMQL